MNRSTLPSLLALLFFSVGFIACSKDSDATQSTETTQAADSSPQPVNTEPQPLNTGTSSTEAEEK